MKRSQFIASLAALPFVGKLAKKKADTTKVPASDPSQRAEYYREIIEVSCKDNGGAKIRIPCEFRISGDDLKAVIERQQKRVG